MEDGGAFGAASAVVLQPCAVICASGAHADSRDWLKHGCSPLVRPGQLAVQCPRTGPPSCSNHVGRACAGLYCVRRGRRRTPHGVCVAPKNTLSTADPLALMLGAARPHKSMRECAQCAQDRGPAAGVRGRRADRALGQLHRAEAQEGNGVEADVQAVRVVGERDEAVDAVRERRHLRAPKEGFYSS